MGVYGHSKRSLNIWLQRKRGDSPLTFIGHPLWPHSCKHLFIYLFLNWTGSGICTTIDVHIRDRLLWRCQHISPAVHKQIWHIEIKTTRSEGGVCSRVKSDRVMRRCERAVAECPWSPLPLSVNLQPLWAAAKHGITLARLGASNSAPKVSPVSCH